MPLSFQQNMRFQARPEERIDEFFFDGGLLTDVHETKLEPNQTPNCYNVTYNETGSIKERRGYLRYNGDPIGSSSDVSNTGAATGTLSLTAPSSYIAQTFQPSGAVEVVQVDLYLAMATSGEEQLVRVELWSDDTGPDQLLTDGQSQILRVSGTSETEYSFRLKEPLSLSASTTYAIVLKPFVTGSSETINEVEVSYTANDYADGSAHTSTDTGQSWTADAAKDLRFNVHDGATAGTGLIRFYGDSGVQQTIAKFGTSLYRGNDSTGAMTEITLGSSASLNADSYLDYTVVDGTLLLASGENFIQKYRGSTNSNYSTGTISVTNGSATVTGSGTSWATTTNAETGEYIQLPDDKWYRITGVNSDTSITIEAEYQGTDSSGDSYVISPWGEIQGDLNRSTTPSGLVRPEPEFIESHIDRVWTLKGDSLRFSSLFATVDGEFFNDFDTSANAGQFIINFSKGDTGTGLYSLGNSLYIFGRRSIWRLYGSSPANFELRNVTNEVGMTHKRTLVEWNNVLMFLSDKGIYMFDGSNLKNLSEDRVDSLLEDWANFTSPSATLWDNKYLISNHSSGATYNDEALFYDMERDAFGRFKGLYASEWSVWGGGTDDGRIYFTSSNQGTIYRWDIGGHDDGYEIEALYDTPSLSFGSGTNDKTLKRFYLQQLALGNWSMTTTLFIDITGGSFDSEIDLSTGSGVLWDVAEWGVASWPDEGTLITTRVGEFQGQAKYFKFRFEQSGYNEGFDILGMTTTARMRKLR